MSLTVTEEGHWRTAKGSEPVFAHVCEIARSGRSRCRKCSEMIDKGDVRFGTPIRDPRGEFGYISAWQHVRCSRVENISDIPTKIFGLSQLDSKLQQQVQSEISKRDAPQLETLSPDDLVKRSKLPMADVPTTLLQHLLPFQKEGIWWMVKQEESDVKSGILADEMGMGKTIQTIGMILSRERRGPTLVVCPVSSMLQWEEEIRTHVVVGTLSVVTVTKTNKVSKEELEAADVVLIAYPVLELSWRALVNEHKIACEFCGTLFLPRKLRVHNKYYCGPRAKRTARQMKRDTSRKQQSQSVINKGLRTLHVDVDDEPKRSSTVSGPISMYAELMEDAGRRVRSRWERKRGRGSTSSSSSSSSTAGSDSESTSPESSASQETGDFCCRECSFPLLRYAFCPRTGQHHVISEKLSRMIEDDTGGDKVILEKSLLHSVRWFRVILDEAHRIKSRTTSTTKAACALRAEHKWLLTGTPLQNRVGDLYSLLRFMKYAPFARYYCGVDGCSCSSLSHPFSGKNLSACIYCGHGPIQHFSYFNKHVMNPITRYGYVGDGRLAMITLSKEVLSKVMLRRTKAERVEELAIPPCKVEVRKIQLSLEERDFYESLYKKSSAQFDTFVAKGTILHNYAHIFQLLSRLRQALDHPFLVMHGLSGASSKQSEGVAAKGKVEIGLGLCGLCQENASDESLCVHPCKHLFHRVCLQQFIESSPSTSYSCPSCFVRINIDLRALQLSDDGKDSEVIDVALPPEFDEQVETSNTAPETRGILAHIDHSKPLAGTKLNAVCDYIEALPLDEKVIVFSQFGAMLDLAGYWLKRRGLKCAKLVGSMTLSQRQAALQVFRQDPNVRVILISLKAGGEGLNLQHANHVVLIDPWWNPAVEMQAVQRAHRIGQTRNVTAVRFVTENTVEDRMLTLQDKKMLVFEGTIDGKVDSLQRLSEEDLQFLFTR